MSNLELKPLPHQVDAIKAVTLAMKKQDRIQCIMACGTGKTLTTLWIVESQIKAGIETFVVFVPSLALINQLLREWTTHATYAFQSIVVCSDDSVIQNIDEDFLSEKCDYPVTNDKDDITKFMRQKGVRIIFSTYHSAHYLDGFKFDIGVFDEAHKTAGVEKTLLGHALHDSNIQIDKRLFFTATPKHINISANKRGSDEPVLAFSMDDKTLYGDVAYNLSFREAINKGLICDYKVMVGTTLATKHTFGTNYEIQEKAISLHKAVSQSGAKKIITYHQSVAHAKAFAKYIQDSPLFVDFKCWHVNGLMPVSDRNTIMGEFKTQEKGIITNAKCLTEGVDVPSIDLVAFLNAKSSKIDIIQAIGRSLRKAPNKTKGYIFLPLLVPEGDNIEEQIKQTKFSTLWEVLVAISESDYELADLVKSIRNSEHGESLNYDKAALENYIQMFGADYLTDVIHVKFLDKLKYTHYWEYRYSQLLEFYKKHGHSRVKYTESDSDFYSWWARLRSDKHRLTPEQLKQLEAVEFEFKHEDRYLGWDTLLSMFVAFKKEHGHVRVPARSEEYGKLRNWVETQKQMYFSQTLPLDKYEKLKKAGFDFEKQQDKHENKWMEYYKEFLAYKKKHKTVLVPQRQGALGKWCNKQRLLYKENKLQEHRLKLLQDAEFSFNPLEDVWFNMFEEWKAYQATKSNYVFRNMGDSLSAWCSYQRKALRLARLPDDKLKLLQDAGFDFQDALDVKKTLEADSRLLKSVFFKRLIEYYKQHGHFFVSSEENKKLYNWVRGVRKKYANKELTVLEIRAFEEMDFPWVKSTATKSLAEFEIKVEKFMRYFRGNRAIPEDLKLFKQQTDWKIYNSKITQRQKEILVKHGYPCTKVNRKEYLKRVKAYESDTAISN